MTNNWPIRNIEISEITSVLSQRYRVKLVVDIEGLTYADGTSNWCDEWISQLGLTPDFRILLPDDKIRLYYGIHGAALVDYEILTKLLSSDNVINP
jgi:hypothetical protein